MKAEIVTTLNKSAAIAGRTEAVIRVLYRLDPDENGRQQLGDLHQYPPVAATNPAGKYDNRAAVQQIKDEIAKFPASDFFEVELRF